MESITERMRQVMESRELNAKGFAELLGIQRSGLSHIYSGRNKPGLDLIQKILEVFPEVSADWLLTGKGSPDISSGDKPVTQPNLKEDKLIIQPFEITDVNITKSDDSDYKRNLSADTTTDDSPEVNTNQLEPKSSDLLSRLILLNDNGTFTLYTKA